MWHILCDEIILFIIRIFLIVIVIYDNHRTILREKIIINIKRERERKNKKHWSNICKIIHVHDTVVKKNTRCAWINTALLRKL